MTATERLNKRYREGRITAWQHYCLVQRRTARLLGTEVGRAQIAREAAQRLVERMSKDWQPIKDCGERVHHVASEPDD